MSIKLLSPAPADMILVEWEDDFPALVRKGMRRMPILKATTTSAYVYPVANIAVMEDDEICYLTYGGDVKHATATEEFREWSSGMRTYVAYRMEIRQSSKGVKDVADSLPKDTPRFCSHETRNVDLHWRPTVASVEFYDMCTTCTALAWVEKFSLVDGGLCDVSESLGALASVLADVKDVDDFTRKLSTTQHNMVDRALKSVIVG